MKAISPGLLCIFLFLNAGCSDDVVGPNGELPFPEQLTPYQEYFHLPTITARRNSLIQQIPGNSFAIVTTNPLVNRNGSIDYEFRPASNFFYLTGFYEPDAAAIIRRSLADSTVAEMTMFVQTRSEGEVRWIGDNWGIDGVVNVFGADNAHDVAEFEAVVREVINTGLYSTAYSNLAIDPDMEDLFENAGGNTLTTQSINTIVNDMRTIKSSIEIDAIQSAVDVSVQAFLEGMRFIEPGVYEYEVDALFDYVMRANGCPRAAFPTIVASGPNINTLHWPAGNRQMLDGELVMIDFGAEYSHYAADVTRTLPVSGTFTNEQRTIYDIVLETLEEVLEGARPGVNFSDLTIRAREMVIDGLLEAGVIEGSRNSIISSGQYWLYIPAGLGHPVGLDVHDPWPTYAGYERRLEANMVIAFEPHIYLMEDDMTVAAPYRGIAVRIEDTVLITSGGPINMSGALPREIDDIEERMGNR